MSGLVKRLMPILCGVFIIISGCSGSDTLVGSDADQVEKEEIVTEVESNKTAKEILKEETSKTATITQSNNSESAGKGN